eukprot:SAG22_NODE_1181_length_5234_cov_12.279455_4_plen_107_part_00
MQCTQGQLVPRTDNAPKSFRSFPSAHENWLVWPRGFGLNPAGRSPSVTAVLFVGQRYGVTQFCPALSHSWFVSPYGKLPCFAAANARARCLSAPGHNAGQQTPDSS